MNLVAYIDFKSPVARLAIGPTRRLADECGVEVDWRPYNLKRRQRTTEGSAKGDVHARVRAEYRQREQAFYARQQNIRFEQPLDLPDSSVANAGLLWANRSGCGDRFVEDVFDRVWAGELDPASETDIATALARAGCASDGFVDFLANEAEVALARQADEALEFGAVDVPAFVVADDLFIGREHLPMIRWLLEGRSGEPPV